jgi:hypothetical protein
MSQVVRVQSPTSHVGGLLWHTLLQRRPLLINSRELRSAGFKLKEVFPPALEATTRADLRTRGAGLRSLEGMDPKSFVLSGR